MLRVEAATMFATLFYTAGGGGRAPSSPIAAAMGLAAITYRAMVGLFVMGPARASRRSFAI